MNATIKISSELKLVGKKVSTNFINDKTIELWQSFMPDRNLIKNKVSENYYSVQVYESLDYFQKFNPTNIFEKWACMQVENIDDIPNDMNSLIIPQGHYAVFLYTGLAQDAASFFNQIFTEWLPKSDYHLDTRPHFQIMDERYKNNDANSQEEVWVPIVMK